MSLAELLGTDDGLTDHYNRGLNNNPTAGHIAHNGITRTGVRFDAGASGLNQKIQSVWVFFRKYGNPTGNITVNIRKGTDDTIAATIGTWPITVGTAGATEQSFAVRNRSNTYQMVVDDVVSVEYPSSATDGFEITTNTTLTDPTNYTSRSFNGTVYATTANPVALYIKGV